MRIIIINYNSPQGFTVFKALSNTNPNRLAPRLSIIAATLLSLTNTAIAQENGLEEIIVKGEKIDRTIQDTVSSVAVFSSTQIEESAIYDIQDIFDRLANVNTADGNGGFTIRGINDDQVAAPGSSGLASLHIDGAFISRRGIQGGQKELWDIGQVEVFRGPQSTNQGRNSLAGAVFIRSNDPTFEQSGQYRVAFGTDNTRALSIAYGEEFIKDQLAFRIAVDDQSTDGFITNEVLDDDEHGGNSNTTLRGKLLFKPASIDGLSILTTLSYSENESGDIFSSLIDENGNDIDPFSNRVFSNIEGFEDVDQTIATTEINYNINDNWSFTSISSYNDTEFFRQDDDDRQASGGNAFISREETTETFSQEFRLSYESERLKANAGLYYFNLENEEEIDDTLSQNDTQGLIESFIVGTGAPLEQATFISNLFPDAIFTDRNGLRTQDTENYAIFANLEYSFNDFVTVFGGFRYDDEQVDNSENTTNILITDLPDPVLTGNAVGAGAEAQALAAGAPAAVAAGIGAGTAAQTTGALTQVNTAIINLTSQPVLLDNNGDFSAFLPKLGVTLNWTDDLSTSFSIQRAYRAGGAGTTITPASLGGTGNFEFDPEFTTNYDFSLRSQWFDNRLTVNANLFYVEWEDQQVSIIDPSGSSTIDQLIVNASESTLKGAELEIGLRPNDILDLYATVGYVDTEFDDFPTTSAQGDLTGNEFNNAPNVTASAGFSYDILRSLRLQADINYQDESFDDPENESENDSRTVVNSKVTYQVNEALEIAVAAQNLFDKEYLVRNDEFGTNTVIVGEPRTVLVQLQGKF